MVGEALMVVPVLEPDTLWVPGYFPRGLWYDLWDNTTVDARWVSGARWRRHLRIAKRGVSGTCTSRFCG
jgi:hypothetical protein